MIVNCNISFYHVSRFYNADIWRVVTQSGERWVQSSWAWPFLRFWLQSSKLWIQSYLVEVERWGKHTEWFFFLSWKHRRHAYHYNKKTSLRRIKHTHFHLGEVQYRGLARKKQCWPLLRLSSTDHLWDLTLGRWEQSRCLREAHRPANFEPSPNFFFRLAFCSNMASTLRKQQSIRLLRLITWSNTWTWVSYRHIVGVCYRKPEQEN